MSVSRTEIQVLANDMEIKVLANDMEIQFLAKDMETNVAGLNQLNR
jgi:hypothetical protein